MTTATLYAELASDSALKRASTMDKNILSVENLTVSFDGFRAVNDLNLNIEHNELRVIIGPNGAGKNNVARYYLRQDQAQPRPRDVRRR